MIVEVQKYEKKYSFTLYGVTQLCGQNISKKTFILESLRRHFSAYKYPEYRNPWRENVRIDGEIPGRKYFQIISIRGKEDLLQQIRITKQSILLEFLNEMVQSFSYQKHLQMIDEQLSQMFIGLNRQMEGLGDVRLNYSISDLWNMVQQSHLETEEGDTVEEKEPEELLEILFHILEEVQRCKPRKMLIMLENLDHLVDVNQYKEMIEQLYEMSYCYDMYFICTTSLNGYVDLKKELCEGVCVVGNDLFQMPEMHQLLTCINIQYPYHKIWEVDELQLALENVLQDIGQEKYLRNVQENIICKIINTSMLYKDKKVFESTEAEREFLKR